MKIIFFFIIIVLLNGANVLAQTEVSNLKELQQAVLEAKPGIEILLAEGDFLGEEITLSAKGTNENPIIISAKKAGKTFIKSPVKITGDFVTISGLTFIENGMLEIHGTGCRVSKCI